MSRTCTYRCFMGIYFTVRVPVQLSEFCFEEVNGIGITTWFACSICQIDQARSKASGRREDEAEMISRNGRP